VNRLIQITAAACNLLKRKHFKLIIIPTKLILEKFLNLQFINNVLFNTITII
jgi:hypothetical protein